jgi:hypothetical protein
MGDIGMNDNDVGLHREVRMRVQQRVVIRWSPQARGRR